MKSIASPFDGNRLGDFLLSGLESSANVFSGASAFARRSGVSYLAPAIYTFSQARPLNLTVGIDLHGTSKEALELLLASAGGNANFFVFHNPNAAFHPKTFRFEYADRWEVYSGSGNLTCGGLFENYEAGMAVILSKGETAHEKVNADLNVEFSRWSNVSSGSVRPLTEELIKGLVDRKLVLKEVTIAAARAAARAAAGKPTKKSPLFTASPVPTAPAVPVFEQSGGADESETADNQPPSSGSGAQAKSAEPPAVGAATNAIPRTFVMTVRQTDVGVGQTTPGAQKRAAEIFIPLPCVWEQPEFWGWPDQFEPDPTWEGTTKHGYGKMDRRQMPVYLNSELQWVTMTYNPDKGDFRVRNSALRDDGQLDDILRVSRSGTNKTPVYVAEFARVGSAEHAVELARCTTPVKKPSTKLYGYY